MSGANIQTYTQFHNILRIFDVLGGTMGDYYLQTWFVKVTSRVAEQLKTYDVRKLGNTREVSQFHRMIAQCPFPPPK